MLSFYLQVLEVDSDRVLFTQLYKENKDKMLWIAKGYLTTNDLAEDAVHEAFITAAKNFQKISNNSCHEQAAYLVKIVKSKSIDILRKEKKYQYMEEFSDEAGVPFDHYRAAEELQQLKSDVRRAVEVIQELPPIYRVVIEDRILGRKSNKETAQELGISESLCAKRYQRGREMVVRKLSEEGIHI